MNARALQDVLLPAAAITAALALFGFFVWCAGVDPVQVWLLLFKGAFGDWYSWQNTLQRAAPLMLTALCVAIPARAGLTVIGGEGALVLGGLACAALAQGLPLPANIAGTVLVCLAGAAAGALWIALAGWLRQFRGINETISSLLLAYVAIGLFKHLVEGPLRDPASLNKPSTFSLAEGLRVSGIGGSDVHWGLVIGTMACLAAGLWLRITPSGFAVRVVGGNPRAAQLVGLPASKLILAACALGGAFAGLAGAIEVAAVHTSANAALIAGYGYAGILVSFIARHHPVAIIPVAIVFGGFGAAGSLLQRRLGLPDASVQVLQGI
ncbi:MAG: ABC transporter permease, partial [Ramlibacter sp.]